MASQVVVVVKNLLPNAADIRDASFNPWVPSRRAWQPTSVLLPRESPTQRSLAGYI